MLFQYLSKQTLFFPSGFIFFRTFFSVFRRNNWFSLISWLIWTIFNLFWWHFIGITYLIDQNAFFPSLMNLSWSPYIHLCCRIFFRSLRAINIVNFFFFIKWTHLILCLFFIFTFFMSLSSYSSFDNFQLKLIFFSY